MFTLRLRSHRLITSALKGVRHLALIREVETGVDFRWKQRKTPGGKKMETRPRILVVDAEPGFIETAKKAFADSFELLLASSLKQGLDKARKEHPDLIVVGYLEPRGTSFEVHRRLREGQPTKDIPLVVVDVRPEEHSRKGWNRDEGLHLDAEDYIARPVAPTELRETVDRVLQMVRTKPMEMIEVLECMEVILERIDKIEKMLVS